MRENTIGTQEGFSNLKLYFITPRKAGFYILLLAGILLFISENTFAQNAEHKSTNFWLSGGLGLGILTGADNFDTRDGFSGNLNLTFKFQRNLLSARTVTVSELFGDGFYDIGLLYGRALTEGSFLTSISAGVAYVDGTRSEGFFSDSEEVEATFGVPIEIQFFKRVFTFLGLGLYGFANINSEENFFGATVSLQLGKLK